MKRYSIEGVNSAIDSYPVIFFIYTNKENRYYGN